VDTANVYGRGASEELLGKLLRANGRRERLVLASKVHARMDDEDPNAAGSSRRHIIDQCHASLRRLGVDHLDVYYLHRPTSLVPIDESLRALDDLVRAGKVRYIGTSSFAARQVVESLWASKEPHLERVVAEQTPYSLVDRRVERELLPMAQSYGLGITVWSPLAGGLLTGKYRSDNWPVDSRSAATRAATGPNAISPASPPRWSTRFWHSRHRNTAPRPRSPSGGRFVIRLSAVSSSACGPWDNSKISFSPSTCA